MMLLERSAAEPMLERISEVAVLPHVIFAVLEPVGPFEPDTNALMAHIGFDPGFAAKVLTLANSVGKHRPSFSLKRAVNDLGYRSIRTLAMTAGTFEMFVGKNDSNSLRRRRWWKQSVDTALCAKWLADQSGKAAPDEAYTIGLLHLLGKMLLDRYGGFDYSTVTERQASGQPDWQAEKAVYDCDHIELFMGLATQWKLPEHFIETLDYRSAENCSKRSSALRASVAVGQALAAAAARGRCVGVEELDDCPPWAMAELGMKREQLRFIVEEGVGVLSNIR